MVVGADDDVRFPLAVVVVVFEEDVGGAATLVVDPGSGYNKLAPPRTEHTAPGEILANNIVAVGCCWIPLLQL